MLVSDGPAGAARSEQVYHAVRREIVDGVHPAGVFLVQEQLAERFEVSRTPVREALSRLTQEGLVEAVMGRGFVVRGLAAGDIQCVQEVREALELLALRRAAGSFDPARVARITALIEEMALADPADGQQMYSLNRAFHMALIEGCQNPILLEMLRQLWDRPVNRLITAGYIRDRGRRDVMVAEHRQMLAAAANDEIERLIALATTHLATGYSGVPASRSEI